MDYDGCKSAGQRGCTGIRRRKERAEKGCYSVRDTQPGSYHRLAADPTSPSQAEVLGF